MNSACRTNKVMRFWLGNSSNLFSAFTTLLVVTFSFGPIQKSPAENIFDLVTQSKNVSKANSSFATREETAGSSATSSTTVPASRPAGTAHEIRGQAIPSYSINRQTPPAASGQTPSANPASGQTVPAYPASGQTIPELPTSGQTDNAYQTGGQSNSNAKYEQAASGIHNAVNRGIQTGLQRGLNHGSGALERLGRKVGLPGLGSLLNSPNVMSYPDGAQPAYYPPAYSVPDAQSPSPVTPSAQTAPVNDLPFRRHFNPAVDHSAPHYSSDKESWDAAGKRARQSQADAYLHSAQQAEARGDWNQAAFAYRQATGGDDITQEDSEAAARNRTSASEEMFKRKLRDPSVRQLNLKWAYCAVQLINQEYAGLQPGIHAKHTEGELYSAYLSLKDSDKGNAAWNYLCAVYWCSENRTREWNYLKAWNQLLNALKCPHITPSIREKCLALQKHIAPAKELQANDMKRAVFAMEQDIVWNVEHPHIAGTEHHQTRSRIDDTHELVTTYSRDYLNTELWAVETYDDCKRDLREKYPAFKAAWLKQLAQMMSFPNQGIPVPPGPSNEEPALYCPVRWEQLAFGPLDLTIGRQYPRGGNTAGHHDRDCLPPAYINALNWKLKGK